MSKPSSPKFEPTDFQRSLLAYLREHMPGLDDEQLFEIVVSQGIFSLMTKLLNGEVPPPTEKRAMAPKPLPEHYRIILEPHELTALENIYEAQPWWREPLELLHEVIREGLKAMNRAGASKQDPTEPTRSQLEVDREAKAKLSARAANPVLALLKKLETGVAHPFEFPATLTVELTPSQQEAMLEIANREPHANDEQLLSRILDRGIESTQDDYDEHQSLFTNTHTKRARHKEREGNVSLEDRLRKKLTKFLDQHPDAMSAEDARAMLADLGARRG